MKNFVFCLFFRTILRSNMLTRFEMHSLLPWTTVWFLKIIVSTLAPRTYCSYCLSVPLSQQILKLLCCSAGSGEFCILILEANNEEQINTRVYTKNIFGNCLFHLLTSSYITWPILPKIPQWTYWTGFIRTRNFFHLISIMLLRLLLVDRKWFFLLFARELVLL